MFYCKYKIVWNYWNGDQWVFRSDVYDGYELNEAIEYWEQEYTGIYAYARVHAIYIEKNAKWMEVDL